MHMVWFNFIIGSHFILMVVVNVIWHAQEICDAYKEHESETNTKEDVGFNKGLCTKQVTYGTKQKHITFWYDMNGSYSLRHSRSIAKRECSNVTLLSSSVVFFSFQNSFDADTIHFKKSSP